MHIACAGRYGYQRDELYFISCAHHLAWGYVDQPPLIALVAKIVLALFGDSLYGIRLVPAIAAGAIVYLSGRIARTLGGGAWAQAIAMLAVALAPFNLAIGNLLTMNAFEPLFWTGTAYALVKALRNDRPRTWAAVGVLAGLGLVNKYSMFFFLGACVIGIALSGERRAFRRPGFYAAAAIALVIVAPTLSWQAANGWPQLAVLRDAARFKNIDEGPIAFYLQQLLLMNPLAAPLWLAGLFALVRDPRMREWRWFAFTYATLSVMYAALEAKVYYMAPIYPVLFAAGGAYAQRALARTRGALIAYPLLVVFGGLAIAPIAFPLLPLPAYLAYERVVDLRGIKMEKHPQGKVPQQFADMLGWETLVASLADAYYRLPEFERERAVILTRDYGQASAVDFLGPKLGLPRAISGHNNFYLYGTGGSNGDVVLSIGEPLALLAREFGSVRRIGFYHDAYVLPDFNDLPIYLCTRPKEPLADFWVNFKRYV